MIEVAICNDGVTYYCKPNDHDTIYERMMEITGGDHEESCNVASWCELAGVGEVYNFREGEVEIVEDY